MFVCQNHGVRSGLFFSQLENRDVFVSCTVRNNAVELTVSAFLELNDVDIHHNHTPGLCYNAEPRHTFYETKGE